MQDEYGDMDSSGETFHIARFELESGRVLENVQIRYRTYGELSGERDNCVVVCHALTGNASVHSWWKEIFGENKLLDPSRTFIVCANVLGSCYGTTGPTTIDRKTKRPYGQSFPDVTIRDTVRSQILLVKEKLGVRQVACVIGGSMGGMQTLEWGALCCDTNFVKTIIPICCGSHHHAWQIGISETQRQAIYADPDWKNGNYYDTGKRPNRGLAVARQIAMFSYRSHEAYESKFGRRVVVDDVKKKKDDNDQGQEVRYDVEKYLHYQGKKFLTRFDALSYIKCTRQMDSHDVGRGRGGIKRALSRMKMPSLVISVSSDALYPPSEQKKLHKLLPNSEYFMVKSSNGHDGFLLDHEVIMPVALNFLQKHAGVKMFGARGGSGMSKL